jgi:hypothetical protein
MNVVDFLLYAHDTEMVGLDVMLWTYIGTGLVHMFFYST